ncbi:ATP-binding protein [Vulcanisaeta sp. JCM 16161]|nr:ATP-binding protein [Vulcanisaeta sp. JCM 16161]
MGTVELGSLIGSRKLPGLGIGLRVLDTRLVYTYGPEGCGKTRLL